MKRGIMTKQQMLEPSESLQRLYCECSDPYVNLANAIVSVAADDYRLALEEENEDLIQELTRFFNSEWYDILTDVDSDIIISKVTEEFLENKQLIRDIYLEKKRFRDLELRRADKTAIDNSINNLAFLIDKQISNSRKQA